MLLRSFACLLPVALAVSTAACDDDETDDRNATSSSTGAGASGGSGGAGASASGGTQSGGAGGNGAASAGGGGQGAGGGASGGAGGNGGAGGAGGGAQITCQDIEDAYANAVQNAKSCDAQIDACTVLDGACNVGLGGCYEVVNDNLPQAQLDAFAQAWQSHKCGGGVCDCPPPPPGAECVNGMCVGM